MIDMRKRFRGNQPIAVSQEIEGEKGGQLYAGSSPSKGTGVGGTATPETELVEGIDGEWRAKRS